MRMRWKLTLYFGYVALCAVLFFVLALNGFGVFGVLPWLSAGIVSFFVKCPTCGKSVFMTGWFSHIWPERVCSRCGTQLIGDPGAA